MQATLLTTLKAHVATCLLPDFPLDDLSDLPILSDLLKENGADEHGASVDRFLREGGSMEQLDFHEYRRPVSFGFNMDVGMSMYERKSTEFKTRVIQFSLQLREFGDRDVSQFINLYRIEEVSHVGSRNTMFTCLDGDIGRFSQFETHHNKTTCLVWSPSFLFRNCLDAIAASGDRDRS